MPARGVRVPDIRVTGVTLRSQDVAARRPVRRPAGRLVARRPPTPPTPFARGRRGAHRRRRVAEIASDIDVPVLIHPDPRSVLGEVAATVYGHPSEKLRVIGITGTSGKTTTTYLVEAGLRSADRMPGSSARSASASTVATAQRADHAGSP